MTSWSPSTRGWAVCGSCCPEHLPGQRRSSRLGLHRRGRPGGVRIPGVGVSSDTETGLDLRTGTVAAPGPQVLSTLPAASVISGDPHGSEGSGPRFPDGLLSSEVKAGPLRGCVLSAPGLCHDCHWTDEETETQGHTAEEGQVWPSWRPIIQPLACLACLLGQPGCSLPCPGPWGARLTGTEEASCAEFTTRCHPGQWGLCLGETGPSRRASPPSPRAWLHLDVTVSPGQSVAPILPSSLLPALVTLQSGRCLAPEPTFGTQLPGEPMAPSRGCRWVGRGKHLDLSMPRPPLHLTLLSPVEYFPLEAEQPCFIWR